MRMRWMGWMAGLATFLLVTFLLATGTADAEPPIGSELGRQVHRRIQEATDGGFWGVVGVARGGEIDLAMGYGWADLDRQPVNADTVFELASVSKQVTATAILKLAQLGKLSLDDTLDRFWKDLPEDKHDMTVRHLLHHRSGLDRSLGVPYTSTLDRAAYVKHILATRRTHAPGDHFSYSNVGYALLAAIVEEVVGAPFEVWCRIHLFEPAGLTRTSFIGDERLKKDPNVAVRMGAASGQSAVNWHWGWGYKGMGGVVTTLNDIFVWDRALRDDTILDAKHRALLHEAPEGGDYACGWRMGTTSKGRRKASHSGGVQGFGIWVTRYLEDDAIVVLMTNNRRDLHTLAGIAEDAVDPTPRLLADIDVSALPLNESKAVEMGADVAFAVEKTESGRILGVFHNDLLVARITIPTGFEKKIIADLQRGAAARRGDDKGGPAAMEGGIYLSAYGGTRGLELREALTVTILPMYRGRGPNGPVVDKRVVFVLNDGKARNWPIMIKMNVAAVEKLIELLR